MKKFMFYLMVLNTFFAGVITAIDLMMGSSALPPVVFILRGVLIVSGIGLVIKRYCSWVRRSEIIGFYAIETAVVVFNLVYLAVFAPIHVSGFEFIITGTLVTPILNAVLVMLLCKTSNQYMVLENMPEPAPIKSLGQLQIQTVKQG